MLISSIAGCVSMAPKYERPPLPVAATFPNYTDNSASLSTPDGAAMAVASSADNSSAAAIQWQEYFVDQQLQKLITTALHNNRDLRSTLSRVEAARALYGIQRAEQFPTVAVGADGTRSRVPSDLSITGYPLVSGEYQVGLGVSSWELDLWGRVRSLKEAALEKYLATDAARRAVTVNLIAQVANSYLTLRELDERLTLARQTIDSRQESLRIFRRRVEVGSTSSLDLLQVETLWQQAKALGAQLEQARALQLHALTLLIGAPVDLSPQTVDFNADEVFSELRVGLPSDLLLQRPDIVAAEHQLKAANADIGAARALFFPKIALTGSLGTASAELDGVFAPGSMAWSLGSNVALPIFDAGRNRSNLQLSAAQRNQALAQYEKAIQSAFRDVSDALSNRHWLTDQVQTLQAMRAAQAERARLAKMRYDNGAAAFLEVLDAQRDLLGVEQQLVQTRRALLSSHVNLYAALGGGAQHLDADEAIK
ncbi:MAG: efflux transporter outer membrane subunit [Desulfuromonadaceae bacterium]|nr:efflux transporter outer membrane subunit [Desulfuromonadaceae bacterium]